LRTILLLIFIGCFVNAKNYFVVKSGDGRYYIQEGSNPNALANGVYEKDMMTKGWNKLSITTNPKSGASDLELAFAAGYLEGAVDVDSLWNSLLSNLQAYANYSLPQKELDWLNENLKWTANNADQKKNEGIYWTQVGLILAQMNGMLQGYNDHAPSNQQMKLIDLYIINTGGDRCILDMMFLDNFKSERLIRMEQYKKHVAESHCSCLIKWNADKSDLFTGHTTWNVFDSMIRTYKIYNYQYTNAVSSVISFSSYPGALSSIDDFYVTSNGLSVIETTNGIMNKTLLQYVKPQSVLSWIRVMVANQIATSGFWWVDAFSKYNSGTYNNQWIITDFKQFEKGASSLKPGTLWIAEQIPGYIESGDMTSVLQDQGYWPSYNIPYFPYIFNISGFPEYVQKYGSWFSYTGSPRAKIFKRDEGNVNSFDAFKWIMRYNDWQNDPLSEGNAGNGISSRFDLVKGTNHTNPFLDQACFGGIDSKATSFSLFQDGMRVHAQSGPTYNQQPVFEWKNWPKIPHYGQPPVFNFDFHEYSLN